MRTKKRNHRRVLVLNADMSPMSLIDWRRAIVLTMINQENPSMGLQAVDYYADSVKSCGAISFPLPSVVRSPTYIRPKNAKVPFSRKNVFIRDQMTCMYCGRQDFSASNLTFDHVIPRAIWNKQNHRGTPTTWTNIVTCCKTCNLYKANRTPKQANMTLLKEPTEPSRHNFVLGLNPWSKIHPTWEQYLPKLYKNLMKKEKVSS